jgi:hypothetical protein
MRKKLVLTTLLMLVSFALSARPALAGTETILGKWSITLEMPETPLTIEVEFQKTQSASITGTVIGSPVPVANLRFNDPYLECVLSVREAQLQLKGVLKKGALQGRWEQIGETKSGYWEGVRRSPTTTSTNDNLEGSWKLIIKIPQYNQSFELQLDRQGDSIVGAIGWSGGLMAPLQEVTYKDGKLTFALDVLDNSYRFEGTLKEGMLSGNWYARGPFTATRKTLPD